MRSSVSFFSHFRSHILLSGKENDWALHLERTSHARAYIYKLDRTLIDDLRQEDQMKY
jgi:hypothetical protein